MDAQDLPIDLDALRRRDATALDAAFTAWAEPLHRYLRRRGASREVAEELVQETFVRLVQAAPRLADDTRPAAWLYTVARNLHRSHQRWAWLDATRVLALLDRRPAVPPGAHEDLVARELQQRLDRAVTLLPAAQREAFLLVHGEELSPADAAVVLGVSPETLRQRLARARATLSELLT